MRVLLQPSSGPNATVHYIDTIENGVTKTTLKDYLSDKEFKKIDEVPFDTIKVWGIVPTLDVQPRKQWADLKEGDYVLFYAKKSFFFFGRVHSRLHNKPLAKNLWGIDDEGRTWEYIYFISEGKQINAPYLPTILGYKKNHVVQGAILLDEQQSLTLLKYLESQNGELVDEEVVEPSPEEESVVIKSVRRPRTPEEAQDIISKLSTQMRSCPVRERIKTAKAFARNPLFSRLVKDRVGYVCEICGTAPFIQKNGLPYAEAHHLDELAKSRIDDPNRMVCLCPLCHKVIHHGNDDSLNARRRLKG